MKSLNLSVEFLVHKLSNQSHEAGNDIAPLRLDYLSHLLTRPPRLAAVLVPFLRITDDWHLLFTRRTDKLPEHSGQVAFPGGCMDPGESSPEQTALREASEEIGLQPDRVKIIGRLRSIITVTNYQVTPIVGVIPWPYPIQLEQEEVQRIFTIPLTWLAQPDNHELRQHTRLLPHPGHESGVDRGSVTMPVIYFKKYDGEVIWGVTAQIVVSLLEILF